MQTYELTVRGRSISASPSNRTLVRTSIGVDQIHVLFDSTEWLDFPIEVTFGQGDDKVTQPVVMSAIQGSQDWAAETTATVPWEVVDDNGSIAVTFQGTDSQGRHLITAKGAPLRVTEAGDVVAGGEPSDAPSVSQWQQAYADAMAAVNQAASLVANLQQSLESMVSEAEGAISSAVEEAEQSIGSIQPATAESLGVVRIGEGIDVDQNGVISTSGGSGMTDAQRTDLARLKSLSAAMADATYSGSSVTGSPKVKPSALPVANVTTPGAVIPDGTTIKVDQYGMIHSYSETIEPATTEFVGGVKPDGTTITIDQDGTIHGTEQTQIATTSLAGKVKPDGTTITVEEDGTIHGVEQTPVASIATAGKVKPDGTTITVDADGTIHGTEQTSVATVGVAGKVKPDGTTITVQQDGTISSATLPDWDENDQSDPAYIANRPFYEVHEHEVIVDGYFAEPMSFEPRDKPSYVEYDVPGNGYLFMGETYRVTMSDPSGVYSGTNEFECGYYGIDGTINGNRFYIESHTGWGKLRLYSFRNSGDIAYFGGVTVTVDRFHTETTKLPSKYVPIASASSIGGIMPDGTTTTVSSDGTLHSVIQTPIATTSTAGKVKPDGTSITVDNDGTIHGTSTPNWNQNDSGGAGYISNRPFYEVHEHESIVEGYHAERRSYGRQEAPSSELYTGIPASWKIEIGKTYRVTMSDSLGLYNGTWELECKAGSSYPRIEHISGRYDVQFSIESENEAGTSLWLRLYKYGAGQDSVIFGDATLTIEYVLDEVTKLPERYLPFATASSIGGVKVDGTTITADSDGTIHGTDQAPIATTLVAGKVKPDGTTITVDNDGTITASGGGSGYVLPAASTSQLGGVKVDGTTITADQDGTIHGATQYQLPAASTSQLGGVKVDGTSVTADQDGTIHAASAYTLPDATTTQKGGVIVGDGLDVSDGTISVQTPDWDADDGEDGHILNRPFYESSQWTTIASGKYSSESIADSEGYYQERFRRRASTRNEFDPTLPARLVIDATYDISFSENGANWLAVTSDSTFIVTAQKTGSYWYFSLFSRSYMQDATYAIHSYAPVVTKLPQKYVDYSPCSPAIGAVELASTVVDYAYLLTLNGSKYQSLRVRDLISHAITNYQATLETDSQTVAGAIAELHDDVASLATPEYVNEQTSSLASSIASLARRVGAIERELGISTMSYEDGTLYVSGTYEDGTLVTGAAYQDGTLL